MENSQPLATESFSHSWLTNRKPQYSFDNHDNLSDQLFNFDFPVASLQTAPPVHADEIFSGGHIMPVYIDRSELTTNNSKSAPPSPVPSRQFVPRKPRFSWGKSSRSILGILKPLVRCSRKSNRVDDFDGAEFETSPSRPRPGNLVGGGGKIQIYRGDKKAKSSNSSPQRSPSYNSRSCDVESSIREAILYCKKSIEA